MTMRVCTEYIDQITLVFQTNQILAGNNLTLYFEQSLRHCVAFF